MVGLVVLTQSSATDTAEQTKLGERFARYKRQINSSRS